MLYDFNNFSREVDWGHAVQSIDNYLRISEVEFWFGANRTLSISLYKAIDLKFKDWPKRKAQFTIGDLFKYHNLDWDDIRNGRMKDQDKSLMFFQILLELDVWLDKEIAPNVDIHEYHEAINSLKNSIDFYLESANYSRYYDENSGNVIIALRDASVNSVLQLLPEKDVNIKYDILAYLDFKNKNNAIEKSATVHRLYKYFDTNKSKFYIDSRITLYTNAPSIDIFSIFHDLCVKLEIQHGQNVRFGSDPLFQMEHSDEVEICDAAFTLALELIRSIEVRDAINTFTKYMKKYRPTESKNFVFIDPDKLGKK